MYWRAYRSELHSGLTYGVSEAAASRTIHYVEAALLRPGQFRLENAVFGSPRGKRPPIVQSML